MAENIFKSRYRFSVSAFCLTDYFLRFDVENENNLRIKNNKDENIEIQRRQEGTLL